MWTSKEPKPRSAFQGWRAEAENKDLLKGLYRKNSEQLAKLNRSLGDDTPDLAAIRSTIALAQLRLADNDAARSTDPESFCFDLEEKIGDGVTMVFAKLFLRLYLSKCWFLCFPIAVFLAPFLRNYTNTQLLLTLYDRSFSNNTAGLKYGLALFVKTLLRRSSPDIERAQGYFGYVCALNSQMDLGIRLMQRAIAKLETREDEPPKSNWLLEMNVFLGMGHYYNRDYHRAESVFSRIEAQEHFRQHLFVSTICYASWSRLAVITRQFDKADQILEKLQNIFSDDYDKRYALRTHSYRSLIAAIHGQFDTSLQELAIANSIAEPKLDSPETCNTECASHLGVTSKIYLLNGMPEESLEYALRYVETLEAISPFCCFYWEASILVLKSAMALKLAGKHNVWQTAELAHIKREVHSKLRPFFSGSKSWTKLYTDVSRALESLDKRTHHEHSDIVKRLAQEHPGVVDELVNFAGKRKGPYLDARREVVLKSTIRESSQILKANQELVQFKSALSKENLMQLTSARLAEISRTFIETCLPDCQISVPSSRTGSIEPSRDDVLASQLAPGLIESEKGNARVLVVQIMLEGKVTDVSILVSGYIEPLNFRRDILSALVLWKEIIEAAILGDLIQKREIEHEKSKAIAQTMQMLAHDLRKPFSLLQIGLNVLKGSDSVPAMQEMLTLLTPEVEASLIKVNSLIADVMNMGTTPSGLNREDVSLTDLILDTLAETLKIHSGADTSLDFALRHVNTIDVDQLKAQRILGNIFDNAAQAMGTGGRIWFRTHQGADTTELTIGNSGSYIPPGEISHVFDAFYTNGKRGGTGLGLAITKKLLQDHGGSIRCKSDRNEQNPTGQVEFILTFPVGKAPETSSRTLPTHSSFFPNETKTMGGTAPRVDVGPNTSLAKSIEEIQLQLGRRLNLLVIDDDQIYAGAIAKFVTDDVLLNSCVQVFTAYSAKEAQAMVTAHAFDIVITDIDLGDDSINGIELSRWLRSRLGLASYICLHSNQITMPPDGDITDSAANVSIQKPFSKGQLLQLLVEALLNNLQRHPRAQTV